MNERPKDCDRCQQRLEDASGGFLVDREGRYVHTICHLLEQNRDLRQRVARLEAKLGVTG